MFALRVIRAARRIVVAIVCIPMFVGLPAMCRSGAAPDNGFREFHYTTNGMHHGQVATRSLGAALDQRGLIGEIRLSYSLWTIAGEPVRDFLFWWKWKEGPLPVGTFTESNRVYNITTVELQKYPELLNEFYSCKPLDITLRAGIWFDTMMDSQPHATMEFAPDFIEPSGVQQKFSVPGSPDWADYFEVPAISGTAYVVDREYRKKFNRNRFNLSLRVFLTSPQIAKVSWDELGFKNIVVEFMRREKKEAVLAEKAKQKAKPNPLSGASANKPNPFEQQTAKANPFETGKKNPFEVKVAENPFEKDARLERERLAGLEQERLARLEQERQARLEREQEESERAAELASIRRERLAEQSRQRQSAQARQRAEMNAAQAKKEAATTRKPAVTKPATPSASLSLTLESRVLPAEHNGVQKSFKYGGTTGITIAQAQADAQQWQNIMSREDIRSDYRHKREEFQKELEAARIEWAQNWREAHPLKPGGGGNVTGDSADEEAEARREFERDWTQRSDSLSDRYKAMLERFPVQGETNHL